MTAPGNVRILFARFADGITAIDETFVYNYTVSNKSLIEEEVMPLKEVQMREAFNILDTAGLTLGLYRLGLEVGQGDFHLAIQRVPGDLVVYNNKLESVQELSDYDQSKFQVLTEWHEAIDIGRFDVFTSEEQAPAA